MARETLDPPIFRRNERGAGRGEEVERGVAVEAVGRVDLSMSV
jgi:hypothetical protein